MKTQRHGRSKRFEQSSLANSSFTDIVTYGVRDMWGQTGFSHVIDRPQMGVVFVIDSGVSSSIDDINLNQGLSRSWIDGQPATNDGVGHGTHVAGIIGAKLNNYGIVGVAPGAEVISLKVVDDEGVSAPYQSFIEAVDYAVSIIQEQNMPLSKVVINFSMSAPASPELDQVVRRAADQGIRFSVSSGNMGVDVDTRSPASAGDHPNIYTVGAADRFGAIPGWSNWDVPSSSDLDDIDGVSAGVDVLSYNSDGSLVERSGSSMAAAFVSGGLLIGDIVTGQNLQSADLQYFEPALSIDRINIMFPTEYNTSAALRSARRRGNRAKKVGKNAKSDLREYQDVGGDVFSDEKLQGIIKSLDNIGGMLDSSGFLGNQEAGWVASSLPVWEQSDQSVN